MTPLCPLASPVDYVAPWLSATAQKLSRRGRQIPSFQQFTRGGQNGRRHHFSVIKWNRGKRERKTEFVREVMKKSGDCSQSPL